MCASDEFDFLPRSQAASRYYHRLDDLNARRMAEHVEALKDYQAKFLLQVPKAKNLEERIDCETLAASAGRALTRLDKTKSWQENPLLYLKIAFIGLDHALEKPASNEKEGLERASERLASLPRLLKQGTENIQAAPKPLSKAALAMLKDCEKYVAELQKAYHAKARKFTSLLDNASLALQDFKAFLKTVPGTRPKTSASGLKTTLRHHFECTRPLKEIYAILEQDRQESLKALTALQRQIDLGKTWLEIQNSPLAPKARNLGTKALYQKEIKGLRDFFLDRVFNGKYPDCALDFKDTPTYLRSIRGSGSFAAGFSNDPAETSYFYATDGALSGKSKDEKKRLDLRLAKEVKFLAAHETYPGHHFLDCFRRTLANPVRRQIENPLFYEGWACFAESLLVEYKYAAEPVQALTYYKRRLWRAARGMIDVGLATDRLNKAQCADLLVEVGFSEKEARDQVGRFGLNPGYQLCYSLGRYEIQELCDRFTPTFGMSGFVTALLSGGEIAFHSAGERMEDMEKSAGGKPF
ncbi:MAG: DUF885 family protein [Thermodesulfobacteriota bacterium]|nr:DUF885 family protein [Thermodesulfobacteriota bacterium]